MGEVKIPHPSRWQGWAPKIDDGFATMQMVGDSFAAVTWLERDLVIRLWDKMSSAHDALAAEVERLTGENAMLRERADSATACSGRNIERALDAEDRVARLLDGSDILDARNSNLLSQLNNQAKRIAEMEQRRAKICKCAYVTIRDDIAADHACPTCHGTGAVIEGEQKGGA